MMLLIKGEIKMSIDESSFQPIITTYCNEAGNPIKSFYDNDGDSVYDAVSVFQYDENNNLLARYDDNDYNGLAGFDEYRTYSKDENGNLIESEPIKLTDELQSEANNIFWEQLPIFNDTAGNPLFIRKDNDGDGKYDALSVFQYDENNDLVARYDCNSPYYWSSFDEYRTYSKDENGNLIESEPKEMTDELESEAERLRAACTVLESASRRHTIDSYYENLFLEDVRRPAK